jgi:hypothetical protein
MLRDHDLASKYGIKTSLTIGLIFWMIKKWLTLPIPYFKPPRLKIYINKLIIYIWLKENIQIIYQDKSEDEKIQLLQ